MKYPVTNHYDGKFFFNPTAENPPGLWRALKMFTSVRFEKWPNVVANHTALDLSHPLGPEQVAVTFVNHATVLTQVPGLNILTDPIWSQRASPFSWVGPQRVRAPGIEWDALPKIGLVLISHNHYDHLDLPTLRKLSRRDRPLILVPLGDKALLRSQGIKYLEELDWWDSLPINGESTVTFTPTQHFSGRGLWSRNRSLWGSYMIHHRGHLIYFGGDSGYSPHYCEIRKRFGSVDLAFLPIGSYAPRWFMKVVHMNPEEAIQAHLDLQSKQSIAIHFGTFQLSAEGLEAPVRELEVARARAGVAPESFYVLPEGVTRIYSLCSKSLPQAFDKQQD